MIAFWGSAIGSIAFGISWAKRKGRSPVSDDQILMSLKKRLEKGEITRERCDSEVKKLKLTGK